MTTADTVTTSDGIRIAVEHARPEQGGAAAVVVVHGFSGHRRHGDVVALRDALLDDGLTVFTFDLRGHGDSEGLCTLGDLEEHDVGAVVEFARRDHPTIVVVAASMGAVAALRYAAGSPSDVAGVVAVSSPAAWRIPLTPRGWFSTLLTRTPMGRRFLRRQGIRVAPRWTGPEPPLVLVERIDAPVAFIHGHRDRWIHPKASLDLRRVVRGDRRLELVSGMGHAFDPLGIPAIRAAVAWIIRQSAVEPVGPSPR